MTEPIEHAYFNWLCAKVLENVNLRVYVDLLLIMHRTEFVWQPAQLGDRNRAEDGIELRRSFLLESRYSSTPEWEATPCSVLEMLYAFAQTAEFETGHSVREWFWKFVENLGLDEFRQVDAQAEEYISDVLYRFLWRLYDDAGHGGLFPLRWPQRDQREVEIWFQFCDYVDEQRLV